MGQTMASSLGQQLGQVGSQIAQKNMAVQPTIVIRPGYLFNVMVTKDLVLNPYY
jgi:type IV secretion system protein VirB10